MTPDSTATRMANAPARQHFRGKWTLTGANSVVCLWHFSDVRQCRTWVRNAHQSGRPPTTPICPTGSPVKSFVESYFLIFRNILIYACPKSELYPMRPVPHRGAFRDRHKRWAWDAVDAAASGVKRDCRAGFARERSAARRRTALKRTAKPCGPGTRCWC